MMLPGELQEYTCTCECDEPTRLLHCRPYPYKCGLTINPSFKKSLNLRENIINCQKGVKFYKNVTILRQKDSFYYRRTYFCRSKQGFME